MARRTYTMPARCGHEGCKEVALFEAETRKEVNDLERRYGSGQWRCSRHSCLDEILSLDSRVKVSTLEATRSSKADGLFWISPDGKRGYSGYTCGNGYKAYADDFPEGTIIRVTAEIILPEGSEQS